MLLTKTKRRFVAPSLALAAMMLPAGLFAATDYTQLIPKDAVGAVWTTDISEVKKAFENNPFGRFFNDPGTTKLREFINQTFEEARADISEADREKIAAATEALNKGVAIYFESEKSAFMGGDGEGFLVLLAEVDDAAKTKLQGLLDGYGEEAEERKKDSYEVLGETIYRVTLISAPSEEEIERYKSFSQYIPEMEEPTATTESLQYAFIGDQMLLVYNDKGGEAAVRGAVARLKKQETNGLAGIAEAADVAQHLTTTSGQIHSFFNVAFAVDALMSSLEENDPQARQKFATTGFNGISSVFYSLIPEPNAFSNVMTVTTPSGRSGIVQALVDTPDNGLNLMKYAQRDIISASSFMFDFGALYDSVVRVAEAYSPGSTSIVNLMTLSASSELGLNPVDAILKQIAGEHLFVQRDLDPEILNQLDEFERLTAKSYAFYFGIRNPDQTLADLRTTVEALRNNPDYGEALKVKEEANGVLVVSYSTGFDEDYPLNPLVVIGSDIVVYTNNQIELQQILRALSGTQATPLMEAVKAQEAVAAAGKDGLHTYVYNTPEAVAKSIEDIKSQMQMFSMMTGSPMDIDPEIFPDEETIRRHFSDSWSSVKRTPTKIIMDGKLNGTQ